MAAYTRENQLGPQVGVTTWRGAGPRFGGGFAGVLAGTEEPEAARALIDFLLTPTFQNDVPESMFVFPVAGSATLPPVWAEHAQLADDPLILAPAEIEANRDAWTERWVEIVLG